MSEAEPIITAIEDGAESKPGEVNDSPMAFEINPKRLAAIEEIANNPEISGRVDRSRAIGVACYAFELANPGLSDSKNAAILARLRAQVRNSAANFSDYGFDLITQKINELREIYGPNEPDEIIALRAIYDHSVMQDSFKKGDSRRIAEAVVWTVWATAKPHVE